MGGKWHILSVSQFNVGLADFIYWVSKWSLGKCLSHSIVFFKLLTPLVFITTYMIKIQGPDDPVNLAGASERKEWAVGHAAEPLEMSVCACVCF